MIRSLLVAVLLAQPPVQQSVEQIADEAEAAFEAKRYDEAAAGFADAFARQPHPGYLYAQAQAERFGGNCRDAIDHYREFIALSPGDGPARDAQRNIGECEKKLALETEPEPTTEPEPEPPPPKVAPPVDDPEPVDRPPAPEPKKWYRDPAGGVLFVTGIAALAVGGGLYGQARADETKADDASDVNAYGDHIERASTFSRAAIAMFAIGGALTIAGIVRYAVVGARAKRARTTASAGSLVVRF